MKTRWMFVRKILPVSCMTRTSSWMCRVISVDKQILTEFQDASNAAERTRFTWTFAADFMRVST